MRSLNFHQFINNKSILVITKKGNLKRLYCPFAVYRKPISHYRTKFRHHLIVDKIELNEDGKICYVINGKASVYSGFIILTDSP
jgi:hypothetical protein